MLQKSAASPTRGFASTSRASSRTHALLRGSLALLLLMLPFELAQGLVLPGGFLTLSNVELLTGVVLALWALLLLRERRLPSVPRWFVVPAVLVLALLLLSAGFAVEQRGSAFKFVLRQAAGFLLALCLAERLALEGARMLRFVPAALLAGGTLSALLGLWEMSESAAAQWLLGHFKTETTLMGGLLRLSATFSYANTAAMYYEALLPLALLALVYSFVRKGQTPQDEKPRHHGAAQSPVRALRLAGVTAALAPLALGLALLTLYLAALLTYSRAALLTCVVVLAATPLLVLWRWRRARASWLAGGAVLGLGLLTLLLFVFSPTFRLRLIEPEVAAWHEAGYQPGTVAPMAPGELRQIRVGVRNTGLAAWAHAGPRPFKLSYHWLDAATQRVVRFEGKRTALPRALAPGEALELAASVQAPAQPGRYLLAWDMVRENTGGGWFSQMGTPMAKVEVTVAGQPIATAPPQRAEPPSTPREIKVQAPPPARRALWAAAVQFWLERPWLGIGPDVFRHIYGPRLGLQSWDPRIHTNNLYLELLVGGGVLAFAAFLVLVGLALVQALRGLAASGQAAPDEIAWWVLAASLLGLVAFLVHGLLDVFLAFTPTYMLFWICLGVVAGHRSQVAGRRRSVGAQRLRP